MAAVAAERTDGRGYATYVLVLLILVNMMNSVDRAIVNILVEPIRLEFGFSDTQIGLISGLGFALVYALCGLPIARVADRGVRTRILAAGLAFWSVMTILTGRAIGFWTMLIARFGVGAGEATCYPCSLSIISDYFKPENRPRAIALFQIGLHLGFIVGAGLASGIAEFYGWRAAFTVLGLPGIVLAGLLLLTMREPKRGAMDAAAAMRAPSGASFIGTLRLLISDRPFLLLALAGTFMTLGAATMANWGAAYLMRSHGISQLEVGIVLGPAIGLSGLIGTVAGGFLGTAFAKRDARAHVPLKVMLMTALVGVPFMILFLLAPALVPAIIGGAMGGLLTSMHYGPMTAVALGRVPADNRGMAASILILGQTVIGFGCGPLIAGAISDLLSGRLGLESLRYAMLMAPVAVAISWSLAFAAWRTIEREGATA